MKSRIYKKRMKKKTKKYLLFALMITIMASSFSHTHLLSIKNLSNLFGESNTEAPEIYDIVLFWGQSNMVGWSTTNGTMPDDFDRMNVNSLYNFSEKTGINVDILQNTYSTSQVKTPVKAKTGYIYKSLSNSLEMITSETTKFGDGFRSDEPEGSMQGLSYVIENGKGTLKDYPDFNDYISIQTTENVNMIPEFVRTYYEETGHGVIVVNGGVGGVPISAFLPSDNSNHTAGSNYNYLYEAMILNFKQALKQAKDSGMVIGNSYWVSFQGESNVYDSSSNDVKKQYEEYYQQIIDNLSVDLKINNNDIVEGALVETAYKIGDSSSSIGVQQLHNSQENIINRNDNVILGSSYAYDHYVPDKETYYSNQNMQYLNASYSAFNQYKDSKGENLAYEEAYSQALLSTCGHICDSAGNNCNTINFNSAALSQIGRDTASAIVDEYYDYSLPVSESDYISLDNPTDNGAYYSNLDFNYSVADPTMIETIENGVKWYYIFSTDNVAYRTKNLKEWENLGPYLERDSNGYMSVDNNQYDYVWAPEIYNIKGKYYLFVTLVHWCDKDENGNCVNGKGYPYNPTSKGTIYYATINNLSDLANGSKFTIVDEVDTGIENLNLRSNVGETDEFQNNNHIDGSLLIDNDKYYFYYKADEGQEIYGVELKMDSNGRFYRESSSTSVKLVNRADSENINEGPYVIKNGNTYYLMYSIGSYTNNTYRVRLATSNNALYGYSKVTSGNSNIIQNFLYGSNPFKLSYQGGTADYYDTDNYLYGTGHNTILQTSENELYIGYHATRFNPSKASIRFEDNTYINEWQGRKFSLDEVGFTSNGTMYVNGPTTDYQPLISGATYNGITYYKLAGNQFEIQSRINTTALTDGIKSSTKNLVPDTIDISYLKINLTDRMDITDIWLYSDNSEKGLENASAKVIINDKYIMNVSSLTSEDTYKLQLPSIAEKINSITIYFDRTIGLSEVELVSNGLQTYSDNYTITYNLDGGELTASNPTTYDVTKTFTLNNPKREGYIFKGWTGTDLTGLTETVIIPAGSIGDRTYTANWEKTSDVKYTVIHELEQLDGSYTVIETESLRGKAGDSVTPEVKTFEGFTSPQKQTVEINSNGSTSVTYKYKRQTYHVECQTSLGITKVEGSGTYKYGQSVTVKAFISNGYTFTGWTGSLVSDEKEFTFNMPSNNVNLIARAAINTYTITYNLDGGELTSSNPTTYDATDTFALNNPKREGYIFKGWTGTGLTDITETVIIPVGSIGDRTYTANWVKDETASTKSDDSSLKLLTVDIGTINFDKNITTYNLEVEENITSVTIDATLNDSKASFIDEYGPRNVSLNYGKNMLLIQVKAENGNISTYTINITRKSKLSTNTELSSLVINGVPIDLKDDKTEYQYTVENNVTSINIDVVPKDSESTYEIKNDILNVGENKIMIIVTSQAGNSTTYTVTVIRKQEDSPITDIKDNEESTSNSNDIESTVSNPITGVKLPLIGMMVGIVGFVCFVRSKKKKYFNKI